MKINKKNKNKQINKRKEIKEETKGNKWHIFMEKEDSMLHKYYQLYLYIH